MEGKNLNLNIPPPDPSWDYYQLWQMANKVKTDIDAIIKYMSVIEESDDSTDERLRQRFYELSEYCEECSHYASGIDDILGPEHYD